MPYSAAGQTNCGAGDQVTSSNSTVCGSSLYYSGEDKIYRFTPATSGNVSISMSSSSSWAGITLYNGCPTSGGTCVAYAQSSSGNQAIGCATVTSGQTYYLVVDSWPSPTCHPTYSLNISAPTGGVPLGTTCANPLPMTLPYSATAQSTLCYGDEITNTNNGGTATSYQSGEDKVYTFTTTGPECISISCTNASTSYIGWHVYNGCPTSGGTLVGRMEGASGGICSGSVTVPGAGTYYLVVDTYASPYSVNYDIEVMSLGGGPSNDLACSAIPISLGSTVTGDNNCSGTEAPAAPACWYAGSMNTVWYSAVVPASGKLVVRVSAGSLTNPQVAIYSGACSSLTYVNCNDNAASCGSSSTNDALLNLTGLTAGATYYIRVDGYGNLSGTFSVFVQDGNIALPPIPGQDCGDPNPVCNVLTQVSNPGYSGYGNICDLPSSYCLFSAERHVVWYRVPISTGGTINMDIVPNDFNNSIEDETDYDFGIWKIADGAGGVLGTDYFNCTQIAAGTAPPVACNYSGLGVTGVGTGGNPPANLTTGTNVCPQCSPASYNPSYYAGAYEPTINATAGDVYLVAVSNFSASTSGFRMRFTGTAVIDFSTAVSTSGGLTWSGGDGTNPNLWSDVDNWGGCSAPTCAINTYIQNFSNQPILANTLGTPFTTQDVVIGPGATLTLNSGATLEVCGNFTNNGTINAHPNSYIIFKGTGTQTISGALTGSNKLGNVIVYKTAGTVVAGSDLEIEGSFYTANVTSIFNSNGKNITLAGHFNNFGGNTTYTNTGSSGSLEFKGTGSQIYSQGSSVLDLNKVIINNTAAAGSGVTLTGTISNVVTSLGTVTGQAGTDMNIKASSGTLTLTQGTVTTGGMFSSSGGNYTLTGNKVIVKNTSASSVPTGSTLSYIDGTLRRYYATGAAGAYNWPVGVSTGAGYQRALTTFTNITGTASFIDVRFNRDLVSGGDWDTTYTQTAGTAECSTVYGYGSFNNGSWLFLPDPTYPGNTFSYNATLYPLNVTNIYGSKFTIVKRPHTYPINSSSWILNGVCDAGSTSSAVTRTGMSGFSFMGVDQGPISTPIELLYFTGKDMGDYNKLEWETASERDNDYFILEKSHDGVSFNELAKVDGAGNSTTNIYYSSNDEKPYIGVNYYRLRQIDFNGNEIKSDIVTLNNFSEGLMLSGIYPNPTSSNAEFSITSNKKDKFTYKIIDNSGREIFNNEININAGSSIIEIPSASLAMGIYNVVITFESNNSTFVEKLVKQ